MRFKSTYSGKDSDWPRVGQMLLTNLLWLGTGSHLDILIGFSPVSLTLTQKGITEAKQPTSDLTLKILQAIY